MSRETVASARYEGSVPQFYHRHLGPVMFQPYAAEMARRIAPPEPAAALEVACGTGVFTREWRARLPAGTRLVATDLQRDMIEQARTHLGQTQGIAWQTADAVDLPFADGEFGALACQFGTMFFPDKAAAVREFHRVLAPGGQLALAVWGTLQQNPYADLAHQVLAGFFPDDPPDFFKVPFGYNDPEILASLLDEAGFVDVRMEPVTLQASSPSAMSFARGLIEGYPVCFAIEERGQAVEPVVQALGEALARLGGEAPFASPMCALLVNARRGSTRDGR